MSHEALKALLAPQLPSIFFCRNSTKRITVGDEGYDPEMRSQLDIGTLTAPTLAVMKNVLTEVYQPLLSYTNLGRDQGEGETKPRDGVTNEFISVMSKFTSQAIRRPAWQLRAHLTMDPSQVNSTLQQVSSDRRHPTTRVRQFRLL